MAFRVELTERAIRDLQRIYSAIDAEHAARAREWFNGLENMVLSLDQFPARGAIIPENGSLRQLLYGRKGRRYRVIYSINDELGLVTVLHIRHGSRDVFLPDDRAFD